MELQSNASKVPLSLQLGLVNFQFHAWIKDEEGKFWSTLPSSPLEYRIKESSISKQPKMPYGFLQSGSIYGSVGKLEYLGEGRMGEVNIKSKEKTMNATL